jgi:hypothetical protein
VVDTRVDDGTLELYKEGWTSQWNRLDLWRKGRAEQEYTSYICSSDNYVVIVMMTVFFFFFFFFFFSERLGQGPERVRCRGPGPREDSVITLCLPQEVEASGRNQEMRGP